MPMKYTVNCMIRSIVIMSQDNRYHAIYYLSYFTIKQYSCDDYRLLNSVGHYVIYFAPRIIKQERVDDSIRQKLIFVIRFIRYNAVD
jgi:hypothetical protein